MIKIVSENTPEAIAQNRARHDIDWDLRELTANLIRIVRGAGNPAFLRRQLVSTLRSLQALDLAGGEISPTQVRQILCRPASPHSDDFTASKAMAVRGALQIAASGLLDQRTQEHAGEHQLFEALYEFERIRERYRRDNAAASRTVRSRRS